MWARRTRVLVIGAVLTLGLLATVLLQSPAPTQTVDELMASPGDHVDQEVAVRGVLRYEDGAYVFDANIIKTSCPSKYEEAASEEE